MTPNRPRPVMALAGASGLVGRHIAKAAITRGWRVIAFLRENPDKAISSIAPGVEALMCDFNDLASLTDLLSERKPKAFVCALGATIRKAGSQPAFQKVDRDYVEAFARLGKAAGASHFGLVSSVGANPASNTFYLRIKGEAEQRVKALGFQRLDIARPGLLIGGRAEFRLGERFSQPLMQLISPALTGRLARFRPIKAENVAAALVEAAGDPAPGVFIHEFMGLTALALRPSTNA